MECLRPPYAMPLPHMPQLDGLRAFAVLGVLIHHFLNVEALGWPFLQLPWGHLGVRLFFVLSGYLITRILLGYRDAASNSKERRFFIRQFYFRRSLRIFPLYYFVVLGGFLLNIPPVRDVFPWLITYTTNIYVSAEGKWLPQVGHFWTLAVEEQFYLFWPLVVLFLPRKWLLSAIIGMVLIGPVFRLVAVTSDFNSVATFALTPACLDTLGMGALLALLTHQYGVARTRQFSNKIALPIGIAGTLALHFAASRSMALNNILLDSTLALFYSWLVFSAGCGLSGIIGRSLESAPLTYIGRISYGIYVYHFFTPVFVWPLLQHFSLSNGEWQFWNFTVSTTATVIAAVLSWHFLEKPISRWKDRSMSFSSTKSSTDRLMKVSIRSD